MRRGAVVAGLTGLTLLAACTIGSGDRTTEERTVSGFEEIVLTTSGKVVVQVTGTESLQIEAEENILPLLTTEVVDGRLLLGAEEAFSSRGITYTITAENLVGIDVAGSGDVEATAIDASTFVALIGGSGSIEPSGRCATLALDISGSGSFNGGELECGVGTTSISGSGDATVNVTDALEAIVSGSGTIQYLGDPEVRTEVSGSGSVTQG